MSDGRKRLSGAAYRKATLQKNKREQEVINKTSKIFTFFQKPESGNGLPESKNFVESDLPTQTKFPESELGPSTSSLNSEESVSSHETATPTSPTTEERSNCFKYSEIECTSTSDNVKQILKSVPHTSSNITGLNDNQETDFVCDPALWPVNDNTRDRVLSTGINQDVSNLDFSRSKRFIGGQHRFLTQTLFKTNLINGQEVKRSYLMYSESSGKLFCIPCQLFGRISKLAKEGFDDWKHGSDYLKSHENSSDHKSCVLVMKRRMTTAGRIDSQIMIQLEDEKSYWRNVLKRVVAVVRSLAAAGLPLRGHYEKFGSTHNCGNFIMCIELISEFDPFLAAHISKHGNPGQGHTSYLSSTTYEEFLKVMGQKVTEEVVAEIKAAKYFSLVIDSTPDISHVDQLSIIIRYVPENGLPVERFLCFLPNVGHKSEELFHAVMDVLKKYEIDIENCRGQAYDNASNMSGKYTGLQARIREKTPTAMYSPCSAHSLNLVGEHSTSSCEESRNFFMLLNNLYNFFSCSTKRWEVLASCLNKKHNLSLKTLSKTRWSARDDACKALNEDWNEIIEALTVTSNDETEKATTRSEASTYLRQLHRLETAFLSILWGDLLCRFNVTSKKLQACETDLSRVALLYASLSEYIRSLRRELEFEIYENGALVKSEETTYEDENVTKRRRIRKLQSDESREGEVTLIGRDKFRVNTYNVILDTLISEMERRKTVYDELHSLFGFLINNNDGEEASNMKTLGECSKKLCTLYHKDLPTAEDFARECLHFFGFLKELKEKERPLTIIGLYEALHDNALQDLYPYVDIALKLFLTIPASNCSAERSFSVLKRIKSYERSTMTEARLRDVAILNIESDITKRLDFDDVIDSFSNSSSRRKCF